ncbi:MAG: hypothetical protein ACYSX0_09260 [Planctomycetota bacterium]
MAKHTRSRPFNTGEPVHLAIVLDEFFRSLQEEVELAIEELGGFRDNVRDSQRPWSAVLDQIEAERQGAE